MKTPEIINVTKAKYVDNYTLLITFNDSVQKEIDFEASLKKYAKGYYAKYLELTNFKKFTVKKGQLFWGKDWDIIYSNYDLYTNSIN